MAPGEIILLSGDRQAGKTSSLRRRLAQYQTEGRDIGGVLSPAVFENGTKTGIDLLHIRSGEIRHLARFRSGEKGVLVTQGWLFDPAVMDWGNQILAEAVPCDILMVDELGPLEFERGQGWLNGLTAIDSGQYELALVVIRPELLEKALARWPQARVEYI